MNNAIDKSIFYVSNLGSNKVSIIHGENFDIIDEIKVGPRPFEMVVDNKNNVFIATDRNDKVTIIDSGTRNIKNLYIPNNGHVKVDSTSQKIYVSNTEEIYVYSLKDEKIVDKISGFIAVDGIELNSDGSKLFTLDIFQNEIKVYDTLSLRVIKTYKDIGESPNYIYFGNEERYLYVSNKGINKFGLSGSLVLIDLYTDSISFITLSKGSIINSIDVKGDFLYIVNSGLNKIEIIDLSKKSIIGSINTSLSSPQRIKFLKEFNLLAVTSHDSKGRGVLDIIDIDNQKIINTFNFKEIDSKPYDIVVIQEEVYKEKDIISNDTKNINSINNINEEIQGEFILANKVISTYKEKLIFKQERIELNYENNIDIEEIIFENCKVIEESKNKEYIKNKQNYIILNFEFIIPYYIKCVNNKKEKINIKGNLRGKQKAVLYTPKGESNDFEFTIKSTSEIIYFPYIENNFIKFEVISIISTYLIKEELILIPSKEINDNLMEDKNEEIQ